MDPEIASRLDALSQKLGVAVDYLWPALVRLQVVNGIISAGFLILTVATAWISFKKNRKVVPDSAEDVVTAAIFLVSSILSVLALVGFLFFGVQNLVVPEAMALKDLLRQ